MQRVRVSSAQLGSNGPPRFCVRHGKPVIQGTDVGGVFAIVVRTVDHLERIKQVSIRDWPFCVLCVRRRSRIRRAAQVLFFGGVALVITAVVVAVLRGQQPLLMIPTLLGFAAAVASGFVFGRSNWTYVANAQVSSDGQWVTFTDAHPQFAAELRQANEDPGADR